MEARDSQRRRCTPRDPASSPSMRSRKAEFSSRFSEIHSGDYEIHPTQSGIHFARVGDSLGSLRASFAAAAVHLVQSELHSASALICLGPAEDRSPSSDVSWAF